MEVAENLPWSSGDIVTSPEELIDMRKRLVLRVASGCMMDVGASKDVMDAPENVVPSIRLEAEGETIIKDPVGEIRVGVELKSSLEVTVRRPMLL